MKELFVRIPDRGVTKRILPMPEISFAVAVVNVPPICVYVSRPVTSDEELPHAARERVAPLKAKIEIVLKNLRTNFSTSLIPLVMEASRCT